MNINNSGTAVSIRRGTIRLLLDIQYYYLDIQCMERSLETPSNPTNVVININSCLSPSASYLIPGMRL